jgi:multisubunit Na+/H+ antiporter MnhF subunit
MAKVTMVFAVLLIALGLIGFLGTGSEHPTALIPTWVGLALGIFGLLAMDKSERKRKLFMHINVTIGLVGFVGCVVEIVRSIVATKPLDEVAIPALAAKTAMAWLLLIYVMLCVRSFVLARRSGKV